MNECGVKSIRAVYLSCCWRYLPLCKIPESYRRSVLCWLLPRWTNNAVQILPLAFLASSDSDASIAGQWKEVWQEGVASEPAGFMLYMSDIVPLALSGTRNNLSLSFIYLLLEKWRRYMKLFVRFSDCGLQLPFFLSDNAGCQIHKDVFWWKSKKIYIRHLRTVVSTRCFPLEYGCNCLLPQQLDFTVCWIFACRRVLSHKKRNHSCLYYAR